MTDKNYKKHKCINCNKDKFEIYYKLQQGEILFILKCVNCDFEENKDYNLN